MKKLLTALLTVLALASAPVMAQDAKAPVDAAAAKAVRELLDAMKYRDLMTAAFKSMQKNIPVLVLQSATNAVNANTKLTDEERKAALDKVAQEVPGAVTAINTLLADPTLIDEIIEEIVPLYARHFTANELHQIAVFYKTPAGAKMLVTMPQVMSEAMVIGNRVMAPRINKFIEQAAGKK